MCGCAEVPENRSNATEDLSIPTETAASLNRSYETGRRTRSAAAAARRSRIRAASSTSSVPATTTHVADDHSMTVQDGSIQASETGLYDRFWLG